LEKVLDFIAITENISVINILLILNPKHSSYWEENEHYPSQNLDSIIGCFKLSSFSVVKDVPAPHICTLLPAAVVVPLLSLSSARNT